MMNHMLTGLALLGLATTAAAEELPEVTVHHDPMCGCCKVWVDHLEAAGFEVDARPTDAMYEIKRELGVPENLPSCHTAVVDGYVIEGHVPAADIKRLLEQRPDAAGLAVPGMPLGSPGMEVGDRRQEYHVILFDEDGALSIFNHYAARN